MTYDFAVVGAGVAGSFVAHFLKQANKSVALIDKNQNFPTGASSAAGAFISPMIGKESLIKSTLNSAFDFSTNFYKNHLKEAFSQSGILSIHNSKEEMERGWESASYTKEVKCKFIRDLSSFGIKNSQFGGYLFRDGGILDTTSALRYLINGCDLYLGREVRELRRDSERFDFGDFGASSVILCSGIDIEVVGESYIKIRPIWGERIEIRADNPPKICLKKGVAISSIRGEGSLALGATKIRFKKDGDVRNEGIEELLRAADEFYELKNIKLLSSYCGARAGSLDYLPIVGKMVDSRDSLKIYPHIVHGKKIDNSKLSYHKNLYILNGLGSRGFVYAPFFAKKLVDLIVKNIDIESNFLPSKHFFRESKRGLIDK